jgi:hypothetical protein
MYACCDQTMYLRTRDGDVCVMLSNLVVVVIGWWQILEWYYIFYVSIADLTWDIWILVLCSFLWQLDDLVKSMLHILLFSVMSNRLPKAILSLILNLVYEVMYYQWSISEMCCITLTLGHDTHMYMVSITTLSFIGIKLLCEAIFVSPCLCQSGQVKP